MALTNCPKCNATISDQAERCVRCGCTFINEVQDSENKSSLNSTNATISAKSPNNLAKTRLHWISVLLLIISVFCFFKGFDYKNNYSNFENSNTNVNAYVGGDAYNYIINGQYFVGFVTMGSCAALGAIVLLGFGQTLSHITVENQ